MSASIWKGSFILYFYGMSKIAQADTDCRNCNKHYLKGEGTWAWLWWTRPTWEHLEWWRPCQHAGRPVSSSLHTVCGKAKGTEATCLLAANHFEAYSGYCPPKRFIERLEFVSKKSQTQTNFENFKYIF